MIIEVRWAPARTRTPRAQNHSNERKYDAEQQFSVSDFEMKEVHTRMSPSETLFWVFPFVEKFRGSRETRIHVSRFTFYVSVLHNSGDPCNLSNNRASAAGNS
jgi:hypothetical protein